MIVLQELAFHWTYCISQKLNLTFTEQLFKNQHIVIYKCQQYSRFDYAIYNLTSSK